MSSFGLRQFARLVTVASSLAAALGAPSAQPAMSVTSLTLINADTGTAIADPFQGGTLDLDALPTRNLSIRANTSPSTVGSVRFGLNQNSTHRIENVAPYAIAGDNM